MVFITDFNKGIRSVINGLSVFYHDKSLWKYAVIPAGFLIFFYAVSLYILIKLTSYLADKLTALADNMPQWLQTLSSILSSFAIVAAFLLALTAAVFTLASFYELFAGPFFDKLIREYRRKYQRIVPLNIPAGRSWLLFKDSLHYSIRTFLWMLILMLLSVFIPVAGPILLFTVMSYRMGITYIIPTGFQQDMRLEVQLRHAKKHRGQILGFGIVSYLLLCIPVLPVFLLPGLILAGSDIFDNITEPAED